MDAEVALTASEISALQDFVAAGGGLFVAWDVGADRASQNTLLAPYGLSFTGTTVGSSGVLISDLQSHPVTVGLTAIEMDFATTVAATGAAFSLVSGTGPDILAVSALPDRVVAVGDTTLFLNPAATDTDITRVANAELSVNIADWVTVPEPSAQVLVSVAMLILCGAARGTP